MSVAFFHPPLKSASQCCSSCLRSLTRHSLREHARPYWANSCHRTLAQTLPNRKRTVQKICVFFLSSLSLGPSPVGAIWIFFVFLFAFSCPSSLFLLRLWTLLSCFLSFAYQQHVVCSTIRFLQIDCSRLTTSSISSSLRCQASDPPPCDPGLHVVRTSSSILLTTDPTTPPFPGKTKKALIRDRRTVRRGNLNG